VLVNWNVFVYLHFLHKGAKNLYELQDIIFHCHRYLSLHSSFIWEKMFCFEGKQVIDLEKTKIIRNLIHHGFVTVECKITKKGIHHLKKMKEENPVFLKELESFQKQYFQETGTEKSCYIDDDNFTISCHVCRDPMCEKIKINAEDIKELFRFKGLKQPYKSLKL
jgi:hypothetical protein